MKSSFSYYTEKYWEGISFGIWIVALIVWAIFAPTVVRKFGAVWIIIPYMLLLIIASFVYFIIALRHD